MAELPEHFIQVLLKSSLRLNVRADPYFRLLYRAASLPLEINHNGFARHKETSVRFREEFLRLVAKYWILHVKLPVQFRNREPEQASEKVHARVRPKRLGIDLGECMFLHATIRPPIFLRDGTLNLKS
jgi:hypothetical protein